ncbi:MAG: hypothetical protein AAF757_11100 [Cyanobacteria bacterium P01_D01_bin.116]
MDVPNENIRSGRRTVPSLLTNYQLPITNYQLPITNYQLPIPNDLSPIPYSNSDSV